MPLRNNPLCHCKLPPVSLDCFVANAPRNDIRGVPRNDRGGIASLFPLSLRAHSLTVILTLNEVKGKNLTAQGRFWRGNPLMKFQILNPKY